MCSSFDYKLTQMRKFKMFLVLLFAGMLFAACNSEKKHSGNSDSLSVDTMPANHAPTTGQGTGSSGAQNGTGIDTGGMKSKTDTVPKSEVPKR